MKENVLSMAKIPDSPNSGTGSSRPSSPLPDLVTLALVVNDIVDENNAHNAGKGNDNTGQIETRGDKNGKNKQKKTKIKIKIKEKG